MNASKTGYTLKGVLAMAKDGAANGYVVPAAYYVSGNNVIFRLLNTYSSQYGGGTLTVTVLYQAT